jgi:hypothetical protein
LLNSVYLIADFCYLETLVSPNKQKSNGEDIMKTHGLGRVVAALALMAAGAFASANPSLSVPTLGSSNSNTSARAESTPSKSVHLSDAAIAAGLGLLGLMSGRKKAKRPE